MNFQETSPTTLVNEHATLILDFTSNTYYIPLRTNGDSSIQEYGTIDPSTGNMVGIFTQYYPNGDTWSYHATYTKLK